ncbi:hypothetical protein TNCV_117441 [Trichonephila clavipes]|nr:hypothetical protein TNCV_117441 [Trichonephila clavipes]
MAPQSSDLNPTEHLCDLLERRIRQHNVSSKDMLKSVLKGQWEKMSTEKIPRFASSIPKRLQEYASLKFYMEAVISKCLGGPPVDRYQLMPTPAVDLLEITVKILLMRPVFLGLLSPIKGRRLSSDDAKLYQDLVLRDNPSQTDVQGILYMPYNHTTWPLSIFCIMKSTELGYGRTHNPGCRKPETNQLRHPAFWLDDIAIA